MNAIEVTTVWRVERYESGWGGWRAVAKSFADDSPAEFTSKGAADRARRKLAKVSSFKYRTTEVQR